MKNMWKTRRTVCVLLAAVLMMGTLLGGKTEALAAMADSAMDFQIGETLEGSITEKDQMIWYRFSLDSRQRIIIRGLGPNSELRYDSSSSTGDYIGIYDVDGNKILGVEGYSYLSSMSYWTYTAATDMYSLELPVTLNKGTYYLGIYRHYQGSEYAFTTEYAPSTKYPSIELSITLKVGDKIKLGAIVSPESAKSKLKWSTSDKRVATVTSAGTVKAKKKGEAEISAKCNGTVAKIKIIVQ